LFTFSINKKDRVEEKEKIECLRQKKRAKERNKQKPKRSFSPFLQASFHCISGRKAGCLEAQRDRQASLIFQLQQKTTTASDLRKTMISAADNAPAQERLWEVSISHQKGALSSSSSVAAVFDARHILDCRPCHVLSGDWESWKGALHFALTAF
jgi:hypothetical protein